MAVDLFSLTPIALVRGPAARLVGLHALAGSSGGGGDTTPPAVSNVSPAPGTALSPFDAIGLDITDTDSPIRRAILIARFPSRGLVEVVHDGDAFAPLYATSSSRTSITNGYRYSLRRLGGWPEGPTIVPYAIDDSGNENT